MLEFDFVTITKTNIHMSNQPAIIDYQNKVNKLLYQLSASNENEGFTEMEFSLFEVAFEELLASKKFGELPGEERVKIFNTYKEMSRVFEYLQAFFMKTKDSFKVAYN